MNCPSLRKRYLDVAVICHLGISYCGLGRRNFRYCGFFSFGRAVPRGFVAAAVRGILVVLLPCLPLSFGVLLLALGVPLSKRICDSTD